MRFAPLAAFVALLLPCVAHAAVPFVLPAGTPAEDWAAALRLGGFAGDGSGGEPGRVELLAGAGAWTLRVTTAGGQVREVAVNAPTDAGAREDIVWLARSLVEGSGGYRAGSVPGGAPAAVVAARPAASTRPITTQVVPRASPEPAPLPSTDESPIGEPPPVVEPSGVEAPSVVEAPIVAGPPVVAAPPVLPPPVTPVAPPPHAPRASTDRPPRPARTPPRLTGGLQAGVLTRRQLAPAAAGTLTFGIAAPSGLGVGVGVSATTPTPIVALGTAYTIQAYDAVARATWSPELRIGPALSAGAGLSLRRFFDAGAPVHADTVPFLAGTAGLTVRVLPDVRLEVGAQVAGDLRATVTRVSADDADTPVSPLGLGLYAGLTLRPAPR